MKPMLWIAIAAIGLLGSTTVNANDAGKKDLPGNISSSLAAKYPAAKIRKWKMQEDCYVVEFTNDKNKCTGYYTADGQWIKTETSIPWTKDLPPAVRQGLQSNGYGDWYVDKIKEVQDRQHRLYVLHVDDGPSLDSDHVAAFKKDLLLQFTSDGTLKEKDRFKG